MVVVGTGKPMDVGYGDGEKCEKEKVGRKSDLLSVDSKVALAVAAKGKHVQTYMPRRKGVGVG